MGVSNLFKNCTFEDFEVIKRDLLEKGIKRIAIDMYVILHKFCIDIQIAQILCMNPSYFHKELYERIKAYLVDLMNQGFDLYLVYDGNTMNYKITEEERAQSRLKALIAENWLGAVEVTPEQMHNLQTYLSDLNVPYIVAPFEADAQLTYLFKQGLVDCVLTNDSDLIIYGVTRIIFIRGSNLQWYEHKRIDEKEEPKCINEMPLEKLWMFGYLIGCDYFHGVKGIGIQKAYKIIKELKFVYENTKINWESMFKQIYSLIGLNMTKKAMEKLPKEEELKLWFDKVRFVYNHQPVFNPETYSVIDLQGDEISTEILAKFGIIHNNEKVAKGIIDPISNVEFQLIEEF